MARVRLRAVSVLLPVALGSPSASAAEAEVTPYPSCERKATEGDMAAAKGAFEAGNAAFNEADYARAIIYWEDAYRRDCTAHALLLNLSRAYESNGQKRHAVAALETFDERVPNSSNQAQNEKRIAKLREAIAAEDAAASAAASAAVPEAEPEPPPAEPTPPPASEAPTEERYTALHWASLGGAGLGLVLVGVGIPLFATSKADAYHAAFDPMGNGNSDPDLLLGEYSNDTNAAQTAFTNLYPPGEAPLVTTPDGRAQLANDGSAQATQSNIGVVMMISGAALAAVGTTLFFVLPKESTVVARLPTTTPVVGPGFVGASFAGRF